MTTTETVHDAMLEIRMILNDANRGYEAILMLAEAIHEGFYTMAEWSAAQPTAADVCEGLMATLVAEVNGESVLAELRDEIYGYFKQCGGTGRAIITVTYVVSDNVQLKVQYDPARSLEPIAATLDLYQDDSTRLVHHLDQDEITNFMFLLDVDEDALQEMKREL